MHTPDCSGGVGLELYNGPYVYMIGPKGCLAHDACPQDPHSRHLGPKPRSHVGLGTMPNDVNGETADKNHLGNPAYFGIPH